MERTDRQPEFEMEDGVVTAYSGPGGQVHVPAGTRTIGSRAFWGCRGLTEIVIPDGVREIEDRAFSNCMGLRRIVVPGTVERIGAMAFHFCDQLISATLAPGVRELGDEAFMNCRRLTCVSLPDSLTALGDKAFYGCERLLRVEIPQGVTRIGERTFANCGALISVSLPDAVADIGEEAFYGCWKLEHVTLPPQVTCIPRQAFMYCMALKSISLPAGLQCIEDSAFGGCKALTDIALPDGLISIGANAFHDCLGLTDVTVPDSVKKVSGFAFSGCTGLVRATFTDSIESVDVFSGCTALQAYAISPRSRRYRAVDGVVLSRDGRKLIAYPPGRRCVRYDVPPTVTEVCARAFSEAPVQVVYVHPGVETFSKTAADGAKEADPFVASADPMRMTDLGKPVFLGPVEALPPRQRSRVVEGFLVAREIGMPEMEPWQESYISFIRQGYGTYEKKAWKDQRLLRFLVEHRMLRPETAQLMHTKYARTGRIELAALLATYLREQRI